MQEIGYIRLNSEGYWHKSRNKDYSSINLASS